MNRDYIEKAVRGRYTALVVHDLEATYEPSDGVKWCHWHRRYALFGELVNRGSLEEILGVSSDELRARYNYVPVYLLDHSGLRLSVHDFRDGWDSGQVGWVYGDKNDISQEWLVNEVEDADAVVSGSIYAVEIRIGGEHEAYICGFDSVDEAMKSGLEEIARLQIEETYPRCPPAPHQVAWMEENLPR